LDREDDFGYERDLASVELDALSSQIKPMITQIKTATTNVNTTKAAVQTATDNLAACIDETSAHVSTYCASFEEALATAQDNYQTAVAVLEELGANYQILTEKVYNIAVSEIEFSIIRQELGDFMDQRFNRVVGDYQDILVALGNNWSEFGAANNRYQNERFWLI
jgi:chromosome segregation ATPase